MELSLRTVLVLIPALFAVAACDRQAATTSQPERAAVPASGKTRSPIDLTQKGKPAPADAFTAPDGKPVTMASFRGKPVLVNLWATWCGPCVKEMPALDRIAARDKAAYTVITVNQGDDAAAVTKWWGERTLPNLAPYRDADSKLSFAFGTGVLPTTILFDKDGKEVWRVTGAADWEGAVAAELLSAAVL